MSVAGASQASIASPGGGSPGWPGGQITAGTVCARDRHCGASAGAAATVLSCRNSVTTVELFGRETLGLRQQALIALFLCPLALGCLP